MLGVCDDSLELLQTKANKWQSASQSDNEGSTDDGLFSPTSVLETCPLDQFQKSLTWLIENKLFDASNITSLAQAVYLNLSRTHQCPLSKKWSVSQKPLIINVGEGSTATHLIHE